MKPQGSAVRPLPVRLWRGPISVVLMRENRSLDALARDERRAVKRYSRYGSDSVNSQSNRSGLPSPSTHTLFKQLSFLRLGTQHFHFHTSKSRESSKTSRTSSSSFIHSTGPPTSLSLLRNPPITFFLLIKEPRTPLYHFPHSQSCSRVPPRQYYRTLPASPPTNILNSQPHQLRLSFLCPATHTLTSQVAMPQTQGQSISLALWDHHRLEIERLYRLDNKHLDQIMEHMRDHYGFTPRYSLPNLTLTDDG